MTDIDDINLLVPVQIDPFMLIDHMRRSMSYDELLEFISELDLLIADWDFTELIYKYFADAHETFEREVQDN